jgi:aspartate racemase
LNRGVAERLGGLHSAECLIHSVDFAPIERMQRSGEWRALGSVLANVARGLENAGAAALLLCTNTMHKCANDIEAAANIPLLHIADSAAVAISETGATNVTLLGTRFTMSEEFYRRRMEATCDVTIRVPSASVIAEVDRVIFEELVVGRVTGRSKLWFADLLAHERDAGADGVILGCTELPMLVADAVPPLPVFDTTALHAKAGVDFLLA